MEGVAMDQRVQRVLLHLKENFHREQSLDHVARMVNISPWRLCHLFKKETGTTFAQYLRQLRMQEAKTLLEETFLNVKEIMIRVGVCDDSHFVRDFKRLFGLTPSQYRAAHLRMLGYSETSARSANR
jgi:AraC-like DNA-binding protein